MQATLVSTPARTTIESVARFLAVLTMLSIPISTSATSILFPLTAVLSLFAGPIKTRFAFLRDHRVAQFFIGFLALYVVGTLYTLAPGKDVIHTLIKHNWILLTPLLMPLFAAPQVRKRCMQAFLFAVGCTLVLSYARILHILPDTVFFNRGYGCVFKDYIGQSFLFSLAASILVYQLNPAQKRFWLYLAFMIAAVINVIFLSESRTGYLLLFVTLSFTVHARYRLKGLLIALTGLGLLFSASLLISPVFKARVNLLENSFTQYQQGNKKSSLGIRATWQKNALNLIRERPILGYGTGSIPTAYAMRPNPIKGNDYVIHDSTSLYLNLALQFGVVGLIYFLLMIWVQWTHSASLSPNLNYLVKLTLLAILTGGWMNSWLTDFMQAHYYAMMMALCFGARTTRALD